MSVRRPHPDAGFTLLEVLIAGVVAAVVLTASWGWLWDTGRAASGDDCKALAATAAASASRAVADDLLSATAVLPPPPDRVLGECLHLRHDHLGSDVEDILICWDPSREVLWRNGPGTYLSDHVVAFSIDCLADEGSMVPARDIAADAWPSVRLVRVTVTVAVGRARETRMACVATGGA